MSNAKLDSSNPDQIRPGRNAASHSRSASSFLRITVSANLANATQESLFVDIAPITADKDILGPQSEETFHYTIPDRIAQYGRPSHLRDDRMGKERSWSFQFCVKRPQNYQKG